MSDHPENIDIYLSNGFNAKAFDFIGAPIFDVTYANGKTVTFGPFDKTYAIPDDIVFDATAVYSSFSDDVLTESESNFQQKFSVGISAGGKVKRLTMGAEASLSSKIATSAKLVHNMSQKSFFSFAMQTIYQIERTATPKPVAAFTTAVAALPATIGSDSDQDAYDTFFDTYGTHYLFRGSMGGFFFTQTDLDKLVVESESAAAISGELSAAFNIAVARGDAKIEAAFDTGKYLKDHLNSLNTRYGCRGGLFDTDTHNWVLSCFRNPILVPGVLGVNEPILKPLSDFAGTAAATMDQALRVYLAAKRVMPVAAIAVTPGTQETAETSGFLFGTLTAGSAPSTASILANAGEDAGALVGAASVTTDYGMATASFLAPVNAGASYVCNLANTATNPATAAVRFMPVLTPLGEGPCFGEPVPVDWARASRQRALPTGLHPKTECWWQSATRQRALNTTSCSSGTGSRSAASCQARERLLSPAPCRCGAASHIS